MAGTRNIIICLDGTKNEVKAKAVTNVFKVAEIADLTNPDEQVLHCGPGVGTTPLRALEPLSHNGSR